MPRSFRSVPGNGPLIVVEDTHDLPWQLVVVTSYVDVPADWRGPSLERHLGQMQDRVVADLAKQGWEYEGGPFRYTNPFTRAKREIPGGFAVQRTRLVTHATAEGEPGRIDPLPSGEVRYLLAARYKKQMWKTEILVPEEDAERYGGSIR